MTGIQDAITDHLKVLFWYMANKAFDEINSQNRLFHILFIFVAVLVESNIFPIIFINSGSSNDRPTKIAPDIFDDSFGNSKVLFCKNIKTVHMVVIALGFHFFERRTDDGYIRNESVPVSYPCSVSS